MKCANCDNAALYIYQTPSVGPIAYCVSCLPTFLRDQAKAGVLAKAPAYDDEAVVVAEILSPDAPVKPTKRGSKRAASVPEVVEVVAGEPVEDTPEPEEG